MPLIEYPDSESDSEVHGKQPDKQEKDCRQLWQRAYKRKRDGGDNDKETNTARSKNEPLAPILPTSFRNLYATNTRTSTNDDPNLHGGRQRQTPHIPGNWPSHIYLEYTPSSPVTRLIETVLHTVENEEQTSDFTLHSSLRSDLGVQLPLHISLSTPLILTTAIKDEFQADLVTAIQAAKPPAFTLHPTGVKWASNFTGTRHFLVLTLGRPNPDQDQLNQLLRVCNRVVQKYDLPQLYTTNNSTVDTGQSTFSPCSTKRSHRDNTNPPPPANTDPFHISIGWTLTAPLSFFPSSSNTPTTTSTRNETRTRTSIQLPESLTNLEVKFTHLQLKIGNIISQIPLR